MVISYVPRSRSPYMYFPTSREEKRYVLIGKDIYEERKAVIRARTEAMINYGFGKGVCREKMLVEYFGETGGRECGRCDVCRDRRLSRKGVGASRLETVVKYLKSKPEGVDVRIMERDLRIPPAQLSELLSYLCGEGFAESNDGVYRYSN